MKYALFLGCKIPSQLPAYEASTRAVLGHFGVTLVDLEFDCCGYPARNYSHDAFVVAAARNLALAERAGLDVLTPCKCCFGTLRHAIRFLHKDAELRSRVGEALAEEALAWSGKAEVEHLLPVLARTIGVDALAAAVRANCGWLVNIRANCGRKGLVESAFSPVRMKVGGASPPMRCSRTMLGALVS